LKNINPANVEARKAEGLLMEMDGNIKDAMLAYEEVARAKDLSIIKYLSSLYLKNQQWDRAIQNFRMGLENSPNDPDLLEPLGRLLISCPDAKLRNFEEGKEYSERAYIHHDSPVGTRILAARNLATVYAALGDKQMAVNYINITLNLVRQINGDPQQYMAYFEMLRQQYKLS
jgi:tetratricopeptide (TPR) repeat protein